MIPKIRGRGGDTLDSADFPKWNWNDTARATTTTQSCADSTSPGLSRRSDSQACISSVRVTSNKVLNRKPGQDYGKHIQDRVSADRAHAVADVHWPRFRWTERDDHSAGLRRGDELRLVLLL